MRSESWSWAVRMMTGVVSRARAGPSKAQCRSRRAAKIKEQKAIGGRAGGKLGIRDGLHPVHRMAGGAHMGAHRIAQDFIVFDEQMRTAFPFLCRLRTCVTAGRACSVSERF